MVRWSEATLSQQNHDRVERVLRFSQADSSARSGGYKCADSTIARKRLLVRKTIKTREQIRGHDGVTERFSEPSAVDESCFPASSLGGLPTSRLNFSANNKTRFSRFSNRTLSSIDR